MVRMRSRLLDELDARARKVMFAQIRLDQARLGKAAATLSALSPLNVLTRGYSVTFDPSGNAIQQADEVSVGDRIRTRVQHGEIESIVNKTTPPNHA